MNRHRFLTLVGAAIVGLALAWTSSARPAAAQSRDLVIFAAASLKTALDDVARRWQGEFKTMPKISYAASSALAKQIEQAAPADIFISADLDWMDYLDQRKLIEDKSRVTILGNRLALVAAQDVSTRLIVEPGFDLAGALGNGRLSMANVAAVPAGRYGKAALEKLGVWHSVSGKIAQAADVRAALVLVSRGEAPLGIVYQTDAAADPGVRIVALFPESTHPPIVYPAAVLAGSKNPDAAKFIGYMRSAAITPLFEKQGFTVLK